METHLFGSQRNGIYGNLNETFMRNYLSMETLKHNKFVQNVKHQGGVCVKVEIKIKNYKYDAMVEQTPVIQHSLGRCDPLCHLPRILCATFLTKTRKNLGPRNACDQLSCPSKANLPDRKP